ncbi:MAG: ABC transporter ATP-binding protein [Myxococcaceae bacterium]|nr:ABC transporter ATP-binding protein [Myxococcaceae bacterium]
MPRLLAHTGRCSIAPRGVDVRAVVPLKRDDERKKISLRELVRQLPGTLSLVWRADRVNVMVYVSLQLVLSLQPAAMAYVSKHIIDGVVDAVKAPSPELRTAVLTWVAAALALAAAAVIIGRVNGLLSAMTRARLGNLINELILEKALTLELKHFEDPSLYDKLQNARREASARPLSLFTAALDVVTRTVTLISFGALLWHIAWWALPALALSAAPAFFVEAKLSGEGFRLLTWRAPEGRKLNYLEWILTRDSHVKEVKLYGLGQLILQRYKDLFAKFFAQDAALQRRRFWFHLGSNLLAQGSLYACYGTVVWRALGGALTLGDLSMAFAMFTQGQGAFTGMLTTAAGMYEDALFMSNLFTFLAVEAKGEVATVSPPKTLPKGPHTLVLEGVSFRYPGKEKWALRDLSLTLAPGEKLGLVGENGAGKSTLIKLLLRLYDPTEGRITYGGVDLRELDPADLRRRFGAVFQDFVRYQFPVFENIGLGEPARLSDRPAIEAAAEAGGATELVKSLPRGLDTTLGSWFDDAQDLSAGQWQKLAVARAFMRDAEVLILDEPTASIDAEAEFALFERFQRLAKERTAVIISHRFSTVRLADQIAVLEGGRLVELGSHAALVEKGGRYAALFELQARGYRS